MTNPRSEFVKAILHLAYGDGSYAPCCTGAMRHAVIAFADAWCVGKGNPTNRITRRKDGHTECRTALLRERGLLEEK